MKKYIRTIICFLLAALLLSIQTLAETTTSTTANANSPGLKFRWQTDYSHISYDYNSITYGNGIFVAVGEKGIISVSKDLSSWENILPQKTNDYEFAQYGYKTVLFNGEVFVAAGERTITWSKDGYHWNNVPIDYSGMPGGNLQLSADAGITSGATNGKTFVLTGWGVLLYSTDGSNWTLQKGVTVGHSAGGGTGDFFSNVIFSGNKFITICANIDPFSIKRKYYTYTSDDGISWRTNEFIGNQDLIYTNLSFYNGIFYISGYKYDLKKYLTLESSDFKVWKESKINLDKIYINTQSATYKLDSGIYRITGNNEPVSDYKTDAYNKILGICEGAGKIAAVGTNGLIIYKELNNPDAVWKPSTTNRFKDIYSAAANNDFIIAVGKDGQILESTDGTNWTIIETGIGKTLRSVIFDGKYFIAAGDSGTIQYSADGSTWTLLPPKTKMNLLTIRNLSGKYIVLGDGSVILSGNEIGKLNNVFGVEQNKYDVSEPLSGLAFKDGIYYTVSNSNSFVYSSRNAVTWERYGRLKGNGYNDLTFYKERFVLVGNNMSISKDMKADTINNSIFSGYTNITRKISIFNDFLLTGTNNGNILCSSDGILWQDSGISHTPDNINDMLLYKGKYYGFSDNGSIITGTLEDTNLAPSDITVSAFNDIRYGATISDNFAKLYSKPLFREDVMLLTLDTIDKIIGSISSFDAKKKTAQISFGKRKLEYTQNSKYAVVNGIKTVLPKKIEVSGKRIYVPAKLTFNSLGYTFSYDSFKRRIFVSVDDKPKNNSLVFKPVKLANSEKGVSFQSVSYNGRLYVAVTHSGSIYTSKDGLDFDKTADFKDTEFSKILWNGKRFIAIGGSTYSPGSNQYGLIYVSEDGITFKKIDSKFGRYFYDGVVNASGKALNEAYSGNGLKQTVLINVDSTLSVSDDGLNWKTFYQPGGFRTYSLVWFKGTYYATSGDKSIIRFSHDGKSWGSYKTGLKLESLLSSGGTLWAVTLNNSNIEGSSLYKSVNGRSWSFITSLPFKSISRISYKVNKYILLGNRNMWNPQVNSGNFAMTSLNGDIWEFTKTPGGFEFYNDLVNFNKVSFITTNKNMYVLEVK